MKTKVSISIENYPDTKEILEYYMEYTHEEINNIPSHERPRMLLKDILTMLDFKICELEEDKEIKGKKGE